MSFMEYLTVMCMLKLASANGKYKKLYAVEEEARGHSFGTLNWKYATNIGPILWKVSKVQERNTKRRNFRLASLSPDSGCKRGCHSQVKVNFTSELIRRKNHQNQIVHKTDFSDWWFYCLFAIFYFSEMIFGCDTWHFWLMTNISGGQVSIKKLSIPAHIWSLFQPIGPELSNSRRHSLVITAWNSFSAACNFQTLASSPTRTFDASTSCVDRPPLSCSLSCTAAQCPLLDKTSKVSPDMSPNSKANVP